MTSESTTTTPRPGERWAFLYCGFRRAGFTGPEAARMADAIRTWEGLR